MPTTTVEPYDPLRRGRDLAKATLELALTAERLGADPMAPGVLAEAQLLGREAARCLNRGGTAVGPAPPGPALLPIQSLQRAILRAEIALVTSSGAATAPAPLPDDTLVIGHLGQIGDRSWEIALAAAQDLLAFANPPAP